MRVIWAREPQALVTRSSVYTAIARVFFKKEKLLLGHASLDRQIGSGAH